MLRILIPAALALGGGCLLGLALAPDVPHPAATPDPEDIAALRRLRTEVELLRRKLARAQAAPPSRSAPESASESPSEAAAPEPTAPRDAPGWRESEILRRAQGIRERAVATAASAERIAMRQVDEELRLEREQRVDLERNGAITYLRRLRKRWNPPWELLADAGKTGALFRRHASGPTVDGVTLRKETELADGSVLSYPQGRHVLDARAWRGRRDFPKDLVVRGRGMDATLLILNDSLRMSGVVENLAFADLTLHTNDRPLESIGDPSTLRLERCRVIGFDNGAGGSDLLSGNVGAFYATDCRIEAGYGRSPGSGNLFDVRGALLVRLERCTLVGPFRSVYYQWSGAAHVFDACRFEVQPGLRRHLERKGGRARFPDSTFHYAPMAKRRRALRDLNPAWNRQSGRGGLIQPR